VQKQIQNKQTGEERWQSLMYSCRKACKILNIDFKEPMYYDWDGAVNYHDSLWGAVRKKRGKK
jgi:hypothetical protein